MEISLENLYVDMILGLKGLSLSINCSVIEEPLASRLVMVLIARDIFPNMTKFNIAV